jgi:TatD DNase family protein
MLVDSHCHLDYPGLVEEVDAVVARAHESGVGTMLTIATRISGVESALGVAERHEGVVCAIGVHPHHAAKEPVEDESDLLAWVEHTKVVGIGESGLDFHYDNSPRDVQERCFRTHIRAARSSGLPLVVHTRDADAETEKILSEEMAEGAFTGVVHCYSTSRRLGEAAVEMGLHLGIGGILTFPKSDPLREAVLDLPLERMLLETDAPYLAPVPMRGKRNEPAYVTHVAKRLAELKGMPVSEIERVTTENFFRLFRKAERPAAS